jgi:hypothetical protein
MRYIGLMVFVLLSSISIVAEQAGESVKAALVQDFRRSDVFFRQLEIGKQLVALKDPNVLEKLVDLLRSEDRHIRGNTAFVFAGLGNVVASISSPESFRTHPIASKGRGRVSPRVTGSITLSSRSRQIDITLSICSASCMIPELSLF